MDHKVPEQRRRVLEESRAENAARRDRVLAHPDLVARLVDALGLTDPDRWTGWIPPKTLPEDVCDGCTAGTCGSQQHLARANDNYVRRQLVAIAAEAHRRETQPAFDELNEQGQ